MSKKEDVGLKVEDVKKKAIKERFNYEKLKEIKSKNNKLSQQDIKCILDNDIYYDKSVVMESGWWQLASRARSSYSLWYGSLWNEVVAPHPDHYVDRRMGGYK